MNLIFKSSLKTKFILALGTAMLVLSYFFNLQGGDADVFFYGFLYWTKVHLLHHWEFPTFSPAVCGGFLLGADPQEQIYTIFQFIYIFVNHPKNAMRIGFTLLGFIMAFGTARVFRRTGIQSSSAAWLGGFAVVLNGYWMTHTKSGHLGGHGIAYIPWILDWLLIQTTLTSHDRKIQSLSRDLAILTILLFVVLNSGYVWFQVSLFLVGAFIIFAALKIRKQIFWILGLFCAGGVLALGLSIHRITRVFYYALSAFPRDVGFFGVVGDFPILFQLMFRSFFDFEIITLKQSEGMLGPPWEWTAYMGITAIPFLIWGIWRWLKVRPYWGYAFLVASILQIILTRTTHFGSLLRSIIPGMKGISWYYRGVIVIVFFSVYLMTLGVDHLSRMKFNRRGWLIPIFGLLLFLDLGSTYYIGGVLTPEMTPFETILIPSEYSNLPKDVWQGSRYCDNSILGYLAERFHSQAQAGDPRTEIQPGFFNLNDVREFATDHGRTGVYTREKWPLWPQKDRNEFEQFLRFKQVHQDPWFFSLFTPIAMLSLLILVLLIGSGLRRDRTHPKIKTSKN